MQNSAKFEFGALQRCTNIVDLDKYCRMSIYLQKSASMQSRTSLPQSLCNQQELHPSWNSVWTRNGRNWGLMPPLLSWELVANATIFSLRFAPLCRSTSIVSQVYSSTASALGHTARHGVVSWKRALLSAKYLDVSWASQRSSVFLRKRCALRQEHVYSH